MPRVHAWRPLALLLATTTVLIGVVGCGPRAVQRQLTRQPPAPSEAAEDASLKAHLRNGDVIVFDEWTVLDYGKTVEGRARHYDADRRLRREGPMTVAADTVAIFETDAIARSKISGYMTAITVVSVGVSALCLSRPKACFGSCPTFYVREPGSGLEDWKLVAEGFSASVAPSLEARDIDALGNQLPVDRTFELRVTNEAYETHLIRSADLLVAPTRRGARVGQLAGGRFRVLEGLMAPAAATDERGSVLASLVEDDASEWWSAADSVNLESREEIELEFRVEESGEFGVYVGARQSLLTTYLFYQALAYLGDSAASWLAKLEAGTLSAADRSFDIGQRLGGIEALVQDATGQWESRGILRETGPLAVDHDVIELGRLEAGTQRVRLRLNRGLWRIDRVALARLGDPVTPLRLAPQRVFRVDNAGVHMDPKALEALVNEDQHLATFPGDEYRLTYELPTDLESAEIFLESHGYYLEWMREEWKAEENPWLAAQIFLDPQGALKRLAPEYKKVEPHMEEIFQRSRYVQR